jgi:D-alanine-D-alanine ligase
VKVALIYNHDLTAVINPYGRPNREVYNPQTVRLVEDALIAGGHNVRVIDGHIDVIEELKEFMPRVVEGERMGMVFNMAYGIQGESRYTHIPSLLEMLGIPYVGSTPAGHTLALDKITTKILLQRDGVPTPDWAVVGDPEAIPEGISFPAIVKPRMESVSFGLKICRNRDDLASAIAFVVEEFRQEALVETFIPGREFAVGLIGNRPPETLPILEIDLDGDPDAIQTEEDKRSTPRGKICPAVVDPKTANLMRRIAVSTFEALGLRDFGRVDIRLDSAGRPWVLEVNSMASLGRTGSYVTAAASAGLDYPSLVNRMLDVAVERTFADAATPPGRIDSSLSIPVRVRGFLRSRQESLEGILRKISGFSCRTDDVDGVAAVGREFARAVKPLGFTKKDFPGTDECAGPVFFANFPDDVGAPDVLFLGRLDQDIRPSERTPYRVATGRLFGTGLWVHKGGLVTLIGALQALRSLRRLKGKRIGILLTTDDALRGRIARPLVEEMSVGAGLVLGLYGAFPDGGVVTSRSGSASWRVRIRLKEAAEMPESVLEPTRVLGRLLDGLRKLSRPEDGFLVTPRRVEFESIMRDPLAEGFVSLAVRYDEEEDIRDLPGRIRSFLPREARKWVDLRIDGGPGRPPMVRDAAVSGAFEKLKANADALDIRLREEHRWSAADFGFVPAGIPRVDGLGPVGDRPARGEEYILRHSILERAALIAMEVDSL